MVSLKRYPDTKPPFVLPTVHRYSKTGHAASLRRIFLLPLVAAHWNPPGNLAFPLKSFAIRPMKSLERRMSAGCGAWANRRWEKTYVDGSSFEFIDFSGTPRFLPESSD